MEAKEFKKSVKLQYKRLEKVLYELVALNNEELLTANGEEHQGKLPIANARYAVWEALKELKMSYGLVDSSKNHQEIAVFVNVCDPSDHVTDIKLQTKVRHLLLPHPFRIDHNGSQNVYEIRPTDSLRKLLKQAKEVFVREYELGNCEDPREIHEFWIKHITVHKNNCAHIYIA
jgi:hypothetical protein